jgi:hypothetical protein
MQVRCSYFVTDCLGWSVCPTDLYLTNRCFVDNRWTTSLDQSTSMTIFKRYATVAYDARNLSIQSVESISSPELVEYHADDLHQIFTAALTPHPNATSDDTELTNALLFQLGFILRLYQDNFQDAKQVALDLLRGFLTVPIQFSTLVWVFVNATAPAGATPGLYALPADFETTASAAQVTYRALVTPWFVYAFISAALFLLVWGNSVFVYMLFQQTVAPNSSCYPEIDICSKPCHRSEVAGGNDLVVGYSSMLRQKGLGNAETSEIARAVNREIIRVAHVHSQERGGDVIVLTTGSRDEAGGNGNGLESLARNRRYI